MRGRFDGVQNVIRFNYPYYAAAGLFTIGAAVCAWYASWPWALAPMAAAFVSIYYVCASIAASFWVYDASDLYRFEWLRQLRVEEPNAIATVHAGFDETAGLLRAHYPAAVFQEFDFYNAQANTEASIARARSVRQETAQPLKVGESLGGAFDIVFVILAAHEIRSASERVRLFTGMRKSLAPGGVAILVEHLRNAANFLAYGPGFLHFFSAGTWEKDIAGAGLRIKSRIGITPFVRCYVIE